MKKYLKQFAESATELRSDFFLRAVFKAGALATSSIVVFLIISNFVGDRYREQIIFHNLQGKSELLVIQATLNDLESAESLMQAIAVALTVLLTFTATYWILKPIQRNMENQRRFIADASHELRTPLSIIKTSSELALMDKDKITKGEALETIKSSLDEIDRMSDIIKNLLSMSRINQRTTDIIFAKVDLSRVITDAVKMMKGTANEKNVKISVSKIDQSYIWGNQTALHGMAVNLLKNAIFYTQSGGQVDVEIRNRYPKNIELSFADTGMGIAPKDLPYIFEPFYRGNKSKPDFSSGSGLGLTIVKEVVGRHGGSIYVKSAPNKGTQVKVRFPLVRKLKPEEKPGRGYI